MAVSNDLASLVCWVSSWRGGVIGQVFSRARVWLEYVSYLVSMYPNIGSCDRQSWVSYLGCHCQSGVRCSPVPESVGDPLLGPSGFNTDTVKMKHHAIAIPKLTPVDRILEAARHLDRAPKQLPRDWLVDEIKAIKLLREVLLGEKEGPLPLNSINKERLRQKELQNSVQINVPENATPSEPTKPSPNYVSDDDENDTESDAEEDWNFSQTSPVPGEGVRRSKRVLTQFRKNQKMVLEE